MNVSLYCDSKPIFLSGDPNYKCLKLVLSQQLNKTDKLEFEIAPTHPNAGIIKQMASYITLYMDTALMFEGRVIQEESDFDNNVTFTCEGSLGYLLDSIQRPAEYHDTTIIEYLTDKITKHNAQVGTAKQFTVGTVNVTNSTDNAYRIDNDYPDTLTNIQKKLVNRLGGYLRVRLVSGVRYLDYVETYGKTTDQTITFGTNMLDLTKFLDSTALCTRLVPLGKDDETTGLPLTITSVTTGNVDYVEDTTAEGIWGIITKTNKYEDVTIASNLLTKAQADLANMIQNALTIKLKAIDLSQMGVNIQTIALGDSVRCISAPHALDSYFTVSIRTYDFLNPEESTINLSTVLYGLTNTTVDASARISDVQVVAQQTSSTMASVAASQTKQILGAAGSGYFYFKTDDNNVVKEIYCMDTNNIETAQKVWRWNNAGLGFSSTGYNGTFDTAWTQDGVFNANYITTGTLNAIDVKACAISGSTVTGTTITGGTVSGTTVKGSTVTFGSGSNTITAATQSTGGTSGTINGVAFTGANNSTYFSIVIPNSGGHPNTEIFVQDGSITIMATSGKINLWGSGVYLNGTQKW